MDAAEKMLRRMRNSASGYTIDDFDTLFLGFDFWARNAGDRIYTHRRHPELRVIVPRHHIKNVYARKAVEVIDQLIEIEERDE